MVQRLGKVIPLRVLAAQAVKVLELFDGLDPLGHDLHAEAVSERDDRADHLGPTFLPTEPADEGPIDLHRSDLQPVEMAERRVSGPEVSRLQATPMARPRLA